MKGEKRKIVEMQPSESLMECRLIQERCKMDTSSMSRIDRIMDRNVFIRRKKGKINIWSYFRSPP